jgi:hypothetical protein
MIIGITGHKQNGKDTFARALEDYLVPRGVTVRTVYFADPLKKACRAIFGGDARNYYGTEEDKNEPAGNWGEFLGEGYSTYRRILQTVGTEVFRQHVHRDFWVLSMHERLWDAPGDTVVLVPDVRFDNEASLIRRELQGRVIRMIRVGHPSGDTHASEKGISEDLVDLTFQCPDLQTLRAYAEGYAKELLGGPT